MISGARLFNYCEPASKLARLELAEKVINGEIHDPVLSFEVDNGFKIIKILPNYLEGVRTFNNASFREWLNPEYHQGQKRQYISQQLLSRYRFCSTIVLSRSGLSNPSSCLIFDMLLSKL